MFYLAFGYFISYLPYALVVKALSSAVVPGIDGPVGAAVVLVAAALGPLLACARSGHRVTVVSARVETHALGAAMTDFAHAVLQDAGIIPHRHRSQRTELCRRADAIHHAMRLRPVEQFS